MAAAREGASIHSSLGIYVQLDCLEESGHLIHCEVPFFYPFAGFGEPEAADHEGTKTSSHLGIWSRFDLGLDPGEQYQAV